MAAVAKIGGEGGEEEEVEVGDEVNGEARQCRTGKSGRVKKQLHSKKMIELMGHLATFC